MEKTRSETLKNISIERSGIIKNSMSDPIYKFCVSNNINNLNDFVNMYHIKKDSMSQKYCISYFDGIIDLINLVFFKDNLSEVNLLNKKIKIFKLDEPKVVISYIEGERPTIGIAKNTSLRRLGFNNKESKEILRRVLCIGKEVTIIEAIKACMDNFNFKNMKNDDEMFITKLHVLYEYYIEYKETNKCNDSCYSEAENELYKLKELYKKMSILQKQITRVSIDFENKVNKLSKSDEKVISLIKEYKNI